ncbi:tripartite tricarboxylate transporter substrate binding protein [Alloyangia pacifica]|uniref:Tripartite-type tricarboxylate transporter, receptor component TctC n=1 Tax=Alloyangia pacifica TaxID=311180 RepID=A0A1I6V0B3_9RHOB|nr:tripartite tricarboxylate transporter substrate binding protein [Alloyangia pacifica]SDI32769.1 Tripartite-type tricarboxylate transporter, receptor component TctC [Alloyangia pacifica]SFT07074.1 Tripartite-type tricarboxylate transporter, receptor component TctC [Alloyangia pacifica]
MKSRLTGLALSALALSASLASAQDYPAQPITLVNPYAAGGSADLIARTLAEGMTERLGQPVVVENRPGAATAIAATYVAQSDPDGYTLLIASSPTHFITPEIQPVQYEGLADFAPVAMIANVPNVLVVGSGAELSTLEELVAKAKESPDTLAFASVGNGSLPHLSSVLLMQETDTQMVHIPYGGAAPAVVDVLAGNVDLAFLNLPPLLPHIESGALVPLGVAAPERTPLLPDVATMAELGLGEFQMSTWFGVSAPANTPEDVVAKLDAAIADTLQDEELRQRLEASGVMMFYKPTDEFAGFLESESERLLKLLDAADVPRN